MKVDSSITPTNKNRWLIALSAICIHLSIGAAYAYSVYTNPLSDALGWSVASVTIAFTVMMTLGGASAAVFGKFVERSGPRKSAMVAAVLFDWDRQARVLPSPLIP